MELQIACVSRSVDSFLEVNDEREAGLMQALTSMKVNSGFICSACLSRNCIP